MSEICYNIQIQVDLATEKEINGIIKQLKGFLKAYREEIDMSDIEMSTEEYTDFFLGIVYAQIFLIAKNSKMN